MVLGVVVGTRELKGLSVTGPDEFGPRSGGGHSVPLGVDGDSLVGLSVDGLAEDCDSLGDC
ncbi:hypothetical protein E6W39_01175 [Kitasatospora acidiphila]|uniref:Uncharacterized protein n=1 Tax=Kitasatospora acidiphila TaxID=2567942 RepID=A0A540WG96_9ACTN|nr:hypothetical protein [Kitasatospora acidiphila]TQF07968.1 hypothetical protein E6W39_01175 [Kitasatospora acidiphila]